MKILICALFLCGLAFGQEAVVVELSQSDAAEAKQLYEAKLAADKAWDAAYAHITAKYNGSNWEFSKDFRFMVPKALTSTATSGMWTLPSCFTASPAATPWGPTSPSPWGMTSPPGWAITSQ